MAETLPRKTFSRADIMKRVARFSELKGSDGGLNAYSARALARDELVEAALLTVRGLLLVDEREAVFVERLEPLVPGDLLEGLALGLRHVGEHDPDGGEIVAAGFAVNEDGPASAGIGPAADDIPIRGRLAAGSHRDGGLRLSRGQTVSPTRSSRYPPS